jgi:hypothetical protein
MLRDFRDRNILGEQVRIVVEEPWDFKSKLGNNILTGNVKDAAIKRGDRDYLVIRTSPFLFNGVEVTSVGAANRYDETDDMVSILKNGGTISAGLVFFLDGSNLSIQDVENSIEKFDGFGGLIGSIKVTSDNE